VKAAKVAAMRILIPSTGFASTGGFRVLSELANHWIESGDEVDFLVDQRSRPPYFPTTAKIRHFDRDGAEVAADRRSGSFDTAGNARSIYLGMWRALRRLAPEYDVILANQSLTAWPVSFAPRPRQGRGSRVYYVQAYEPEYYALERGAKARVLQALSALSYRLPLRQVANAPIYVGHPHIQAADWIPPGVDARRFHRRSTPALRSSGVTLGVIGRHERTKGTADVLAAFEQLAGRHPDIRLSVAFGNLPAGWQHPRAEIVVPRNDDELAAWYRGLDVMLAPGTVQLGACHYPVLEAMASGVPLITTGYLPADSSNAWIVPVHAPEAIAAAVEDVMATSPAALEARLDRAAAAIEPFFWPNVARRFGALLRAAT
jgi:glycosyltransferase involved in cell wall biosynthesis